MVKGERIVTNLVGQGIVFDKLPNEELSEQRGIIRAVRAVNGELVYTVQLVSTDRLVETKSYQLFKLI